MLATKVSKQANEKDVPVKPIYTNMSKTGFKYPYYDYYCPSCGVLAAYDAVGKRRISRGEIEIIRTRCRSCGQAIVWED